MSSSVKHTTTYFCTCLKQQCCRQKYNALLPHFWRQCIRLLKSDSCALIHRQFLIVENTISCSFAYSQNAAARNCTRRRNRCVARSTDSLPTSSCIAEKNQHSFPCPCLKLDVKPGCGKEPLSMFL